MKVSSILLYVLAFSILLGILALLKARSKRGRRGATAAYRAKRVLTSPEAVLYHRLEQALPDHIVLAQVAMHRVLSATEGGKAAFNAISQKAIDFVICRKDFSVACVVELDDASHRRDRDVARDEMLAGAEIATVRFQAKALPTVGDIGMQLSRHLALPAQGQRAVASARDAYKKVE